MAERTLASAVLLHATLLGAQLVISMLFSPDHTVGEVKRVLAQYVLEKQLVDVGDLGLESTSAAKKLDFIASKLKFVRFGASSCYFGTPCGDKTYKKYMLRQRVVRRESAPALRRSAR
jgi:hypothetical protein